MIGEIPRRGVMKQLIVVVLIFLASVCYVESVFAHCEIPCGIYDDVMSVDMIAEHIATIEQSMEMIEELSKEKEKNYNQIARWVTNKETHAQHIQDIVSRYFLTQRIKPVTLTNLPEYSEYVRMLRIMHELLLQAMKAKQTTNPIHVKNLRSLLNEFRSEFFVKMEEKYSES